MKHLHSPNCRHLCAPFWPVPPLIFSYFVRIYQKCHLFNLNLTIFDVGVNFNIFSKVRPFGSAARGDSPLCSPSVRHWFPYPSFQIPSPASLFSTVVPSSLPSASRRRPPPPQAKDLWSQCAQWQMNVSPMASRETCFEWEEEDPGPTDKQTNRPCIIDACIACHFTYVWTPCLYVSMLCVYAYLHVCMCIHMFSCTYVLKYM